MTEHVPEQEYLVIESLIGIRQGVIEKLQSALRRAETMEEKLALKKGIKAASNWQVIL